MDLKTKITKIHYTKNEKGLGFLMLKPFSFFYFLVVGFRNFLYDKNILKSERVDAYVISVGNLTTGGVGKTPVVAEIAKYLQSKGEKIAIVSRGYGGKLSNKQVNIISDGEKVYYNAELAGDEAYWFSENLKGVCVLTSKSRINAVKIAIEKFNVTKIILDDGFQHRKIYRDLDIVLIDSEKQLGNGNLLPAGPLRESKSNIKRADRVLIMDKSGDLLKSREFSKQFEKSFVCNVRPDKIYNIKTGAGISKEAPSVAICAIGQPQQFFDFLKDYNILYKKTFDDHHIYELKDIEKIEESIITTEKDAVKLLKFDKDNIFALKLKLDLDVEALLR